MKWKATYVVCPGGVRTGGPEALHQLVHELRSLKHDAFIHYVGSEQKPSEYDCYDTPQATPLDVEDNLVVVPEIWPNMTSGYTRADIAVWWLSPRGIFDVMRLPRFYNECHHLAQCWATFRQLEDHSPRHLDVLTDYLNPEHFKKRPPGARTPRVIWNPGRRGTRMDELLGAPGIEYLALEGMSQAEIIEAMETSMVYLDLSVHMAKDRMPREAAIHGCIVLALGINAMAERGDHAMPWEFLVGRQDTTDDIESRIRMCLEGYGRFVRYFDSYRDQIRRQRGKFVEEIARIWEL